MAEAPPHGTTSRYRWRKKPCRCLECRAANTKYMAELRDRKRDPNKKKKKTPRKSEDIPHGDRRRYINGCHCEPCTKANRDYQREYMRNWRLGIPMIDITDV